MKTSPCRWCRWFEGCSPHADAPPLGFTVAAICYHRAMPSPRRFPPPWSIEERQESFIVKDANARQMSMKRLSRDEAFLIAVNIAKLPSVPRQILKDIPRPPNTASRDD